MPIGKERFTADDAEQLFCQVHNIDDAAEAAKIFIERTSPPNLEGEAFFNMTERTLLQSLIEYQRLYGRQSKMIVWSIYGLLLESRLNDPDFPGTTAGASAPMSKLDKRFLEVKQTNEDSAAAASYFKFKAASVIIEGPVLISLMMRFQYLLTETTDAKNCTRTIKGTVPALC